MKFSSKLVSALLVSFAVAAPMAQAAPTLTTFTDRAAFELAMWNISVDTLNRIQQDSFNNAVRAEFTINTPGMFGCVNHGGCGNNFELGYDNAYIWNYMGVDTFIFDTAVNGFGFDYSSPYGYSSQNIQTSIEGQSSGSNNSGFFGVISSQSMTTWHVDQTASFMLMDNITSGMTFDLVNDVPEPALPALMSLGLLGLALSRRKSKK